MTKCKCKCNKTKLNKMINRGILIVISVFGPHCIIIKESSSFMVYLAYVSVCECLCECVWAYGACAGRGRGAGQGHHLLNGQSQFEAVQRVTDADLSLDLCVWQVSHDGSTLHVSTTGSHVPCRHAHPQLKERERWPLGKHKTKKVLTGSAFS